MSQAAPIFMLCSGEFGCDCPKRRAARKRSYDNLRGHGSRSKYQKGCRCLPCRRGNNRYAREYRARKGTTWTSVSFN